jgi:ssDNA-binding Zn-finger/Zn-ribbon topoisomerase 1
METTGVTISCVNCGIIRVDDSGNFDKEIKYVEYSHCPKCNLTAAPITAIRVFRNHGGSIIVYNAFYRRMVIK